MTSLPRERYVRKKLGAFYSPRSLVEPMVGWAVRKATDTVLDPSCGDGVFAETAARRLRVLGAGPAAIVEQLHAVDLNPDAVRMTTEALRPVVAPFDPNVRAQSFFHMEPPDDLFSEGFFDVVVGNPPYIRYQEFAGTSRTQALRRASDAGVSLTGLASSWAHFVAHAVTFLRKGGRFALILPAELIHASYAAPLRRFLRASFGKVTVVSFREAVFPGAQEEVVVVLAEGHGEEHHSLSLVELTSPQDLPRLDQLEAQSFEKGVEPAKWVPRRAADRAAAILTRLEGLGLMTPLGQAAKASIGFVSGANEFFVLTPEEAARWKLPAASLLYALVRARQMPDLLVTKRDIARLVSQNERCLLWLPGPEPTASERAYIRHGEEIGVHEHYKCRVRTPWYRVPGVVVPEAFLTYMSATFPRLARNQAGATTTNNLHAVRLSEIPPALRRAFVVAFYNSATLLSCEWTGRSYGGGVLKLEPSEADRIHVPAVSLVRKHREALERLEKPLREALRKGGELITPLIEAVDRALLLPNGLHENEVVELRQAREDLAERRHSRARSNRGMQTLPLPL